MQKVARCDWYLYNILCFVIRCDLMLQKFCILHTLVYVVVEYYRWLSAFYIVVNSVLCGPLIEKFAYP